MQPGDSLDRPLRLRPILKQARWGGRQLGEVLGRPIGPESDWAESWEVADCPGAKSVIAGGPHEGETLADLLRKFPRQLLGDGFSEAAAETSPAFPLLIKYLDAADVLSVQVHPNDAQAARMHPGQRGKTEAWVILDARLDSRLYCGLKAGIDREQLREAIDSGTVADCLHEVPARRGDCLFIPAGTVHAIGGGILLAEVQQSSDLTFRLDDWGRLGADGQPRPLHIEQSLECIDFARGPVNPVIPQRADAGSPPVETVVETLVDCEYFSIRRHVIPQTQQLPAAAGCRILLAIEGQGTLQSGGVTDQLERAAVRLIPAACGELTVIPDGDSPGRLTVLEVGIPAAG